MCIDFRQVHYGFLCKQFSFRAQFPRCTLVIIRFIHGEPFRPTINSLQMSAISRKAKKEVQLTSFLTALFGSSSTGNSIFNTWRLYGSKSSPRSAPGKERRARSAAIRTRGGLWIGPVASSSPALDEGVREQALRSRVITEETCSFSDSADSFIVT